MKKAAGAVLALALMCLTSGNVRGGDLSFEGHDEPLVSLVRVTIGANDARIYEMAGSIVSNGQPLGLTGVGTYDPVSRKAVEAIVEGGEDRIQTMATCTLDPWQFGTSTCSNGMVNAKGYEAKITKYISGLTPPISVIPGSDRTSYAVALQAAEKAAAIKKARMGSVHKIEAVPTPTPTPHTRVGETAQIAKLPTPKTLPTPTPAPLYGAVYTGGNPPATLKVGQVVSVPVSVQNTSSQTWPAGGVFHLAFHWFRGGVQIVHDGDRTFMPTAVAPGATVNLNAKVTAPPSAGATTLQWDMVQEGVTWFSDKGVPMSAAHNVTVNP